MNENNEIKQIKKIDEELMKADFNPTNTYAKAKQYLQTFLSSTNNKEKQELLQQVKLLKEKENNIINTVLNKNKNKQK